MRAGRRKSARGDTDLRTDASRKGRRAGQHAELVETYLAEVGRCREFRSFARDVATRQDRPLDGLASWAQSLADYERMIARGREMLAGQLVATGSSQADDTGMAAVRTAVETLEEEWRRDLFGSDYRSDGADVRQRKRSPRAGAGGGERGANAPGNAEPLNRPVMLPGVGDGVRARLSAAFPRQGAVGPASGGVFRPGGRIRAAFR